MSVIEQKIVTISLLDDNGLGVTSDAKVKVPFVLPSERIKYTKHSYRNKTNFILDEVLDCSSYRIAPSCKYFTICGGCKLQHASYELYNNYKTNLISKEISSFSTNTIISKLVSIAPRSRRRLQMSFAKKGDKVFMGFQKLNSHKIVDIDSCYIAEDDLVQLFMPLKMLLSSTLSDAASGELHLLKADNGISMEIEMGKGDLLPEIKEKVKEFSHQHQVIEIKINSIVLYSKFPAVINFSGIDIKVNAKCFLQASKFSDDFLAREVTNYLDQIYPDNRKNEIKIADLFCGRGTFTIPLANYGTVHGYESDSEAVKALGDAIRLNNLNIKLAERDLFTFPLFANDLNKFDVIVMNPPRAGASAQVKELVKSNVKYLIYISCNPKTFVSDAKELYKNGYKLEALTPFDQFLYSNHLELVGFFSKK